MAVGRYEAIADVFGTAIADTIKSGKEGLANTIDRQRQANNQMLINAGASVGQIQASQQIFDQRAMDQIGKYESQAFASTLQNYDKLASLRNTAKQQKASVYNLLTEKSDKGTLDEKTYSGVLGIYGLTEDDLSRDLFNIK